ncbi:hypothetical protein [Insolitispirillum peregrinum]|uniref:hypothetical protein n=1 Tax=Insolitispirillum peregrinum TaxID=80876 RepID=UPI00360983F9
MSPNAPVAPDRRPSLTRPLLSRLLAPCALAVALTACAASEPPQTTATGPHGTATGVAGPLSGRWVVSDVHPSGQVSLSADDRKALVGRPVLLDDTRAEDVAGRICETPSYVMRAITFGEAVQTRQPMAGQDERVTVVSVGCGTVPFATFIALPKGVLLAEHHGTLVSLIPAAAATPMTVPVTTPIAMAATAPAPTESANKDNNVGKDALEGQKATATPDSKLGMHLASYRGEGMAREGWTELKKEVPALAALTPRYVPVKLTLKGAKEDFVRLYAVGLSQADMYAQCTQMRKQHKYCVVMPLAQ